MDHVLDCTVRWLRNLSRNAFKVPEEATRVDSAWYAGMAIRPAEFSEQLAALQSSLQNTPQSAPVTERLPG